MGYIRLAKEWLRSLLRLTTNGVRVVVSVRVALMTLIKITLFT